MRKSRSKKWRHVYPYICSRCGKKRLAFDHDRAKKSLCRVCQPAIVHDDQGTLFENNETL